MVTWVSQEGFSLPWSGASTHIFSSMSNCLFKETIILITSLSVGSLLEFVFLHSPSLYLHKNPYKERISKNVRWCLCQLGHFTPHILSFFHSRVSTIHSLAPLYLLSLIIIGRNSENPFWEILLLLLGSAFDYSMPLLMVPQVPFQCIPSLNRASHLRCSLAIMLPINNKLLLKSPKSHFHHGFPLFILFSTSFHKQGRPF